MKDEMNASLAKATVNNLSSARYLELYQVTEEDLAAVEEVGKELLTDLDKLIDSFYDWLPTLEETAHFFPDLQAADQIKALQKKILEPILPCSGE